MAQPYYCIRDSVTGLFFEGISEIRLNPTDIVWQGYFLVMSKRVVGKRIVSLGKLEKNLRNFFCPKEENIVISSFPETFEVVYVVPASYATKRTITSTDYSLPDLIKRVVTGPAFSDVMRKIAERQATDFKYVLVISRAGFWTDTENIDIGMRLVRSGATIRSTVRNQTAIAFKTENDAVAFRLGYTGFHNVKTVVLE